jgi:hypothetical protein
MKPYNKSTEQILKQFIWDYDISTQDMYNCLAGQQQYAGFYNRDTLLTKAFNQLNYRDLIHLFDLDEIRQILTTNFIKTLRFQQVQLKYEILRKILYGEPLPPSKWDNPANKFPEYIILSNRWYRP